MRVWHTIKKTFCDIEDVVIRLLCEPKTEKTPRSKARNHLGQQSEAHPGIAPIIILLTFSLFIFAKSDLLAMISNLSSELRNDYYVDFNGPFYTQCIVSAIL